jgi:hypothetical protein
MTIEQIIAGYAAIVATGAAIVPIWQARTAHKPKVEIELVHTKGAMPDGRPFYMVTLEVRNRGDHPVRVVTAYISSPKVTYQFEENLISVQRRLDNSMLIMDVDDSEASSHSPNLPLPGIILPRDAASRFLTIKTLWRVEQIAAEAAAGERPLLDADPNCAAIISQSLHEELQGGISISTGEAMRSKAVTFDWNAFKKK